MEKFKLDNLARLSACLITNRLISHVNPLQQCHTVHKYNGMIITDLGDENKTQVLSTFNVKKGASTLYVGGMQLKYHSFQIP